MAFNFSRWSLGALFHYKSKVRGEPVSSHRVSNPFHAVSVAAGNRACEVAREVEGKRFLSVDAPTLPLPGCNAATCRCRYLHHSDRRSDEPRREVDSGIVNMTGSWTKVDRRKRRGRRRDDS